MSSQFPGGELPGMNAMNDTLAFVKKLWGGMQVPGMITPSLSVDDLDKKISDLKTVESWLNVNMNMLRATIQALEVQRATIATLNALGETFAQGAPAPEASAFTSAAKKYASQWPMHGAAPASPPTEAAQKAPPAAAASQANAGPVGRDEAKPAKASGTNEASEVSENTASFVNPAAWWNLLQDQFKQAVSNAMATETDGKTATAGSANNGKKAAPTAADKPARGGAKKPASGGRAGKSVSGAAAKKRAVVKKTTAAATQGKNGTPKP